MHRLNGLIVVLVITSVIIAVIAFWPQGQTQAVADQQNSVSDCDDDFGYGCPPDDEDTEDDSADSDDDSGDSDDGDTDTEDE